MHLEGQLREMRRALVDDEFQIERIGVDRAVYSFEISAEQRQKIHAHQ